MSAWYTEIAAQQAPQLRAASINMKFFCILGCAFAYEDDVLLKFVP